MEYRYGLVELQMMAEELAGAASSPFSFFLSGEVGTGKTTFSQFFIRSILIDKNQVITSPTFNIVQIYETIKGPVWHVDLYRIKDFDEINDLGLLEALDESICLIEWPELIKDIDLQCAHKEIQFDLCCL